VSQQTSVEFSIKASSNAHIRLTLDDGSIIVNVIDGWIPNYKSTFRAAVWTPDLVEKYGRALDVDTYIFFRLNWNDDNMVLERATTRGAYSTWITLDQWRSHVTGSNIVKMDFATGFSAEGYWKVYF